VSGRNRTKFFFTASEKDNKAEDTLDLMRLLILQEASSHGKTQSHEGLNWFNTHRNAMVHILVSSAIAIVWANPLTMLSSFPLYAFNIDNLIISCIIATKWTILDTVCPLDSALGLPEGYPLDIEKRLRRTPPSAVLHLPFKIL
jgi:hypothetical protein